MAPGAEGPGDFIEVLAGEVAQHAVLHEAELAGVDEEGFAAAVAEGDGTGTGALGFVFREEPDAGGNLGVGEELAGQGNHALDEIRLDQGAADVALAAGIGTHRAIG